MVREGATRRSATKGGAADGGASVDPRRDEAAERIVSRLRDRNLVLVGMMGVGKTSVGKRLAAELGLSFVDADQEIEKAANQSIPEIFATHGEPYFREGERRVIHRLLLSGPGVIATGGGAYLSVETREAIARRGIAIWLKAEVDVLMHRVRRKSNRPLLAQPDPEGVMRRLLAEREPVYALADLTITSREVPVAAVAADVIAALDAHLGREAANG